MRGGTWRNLLIVTLAVGGALSAVAVLGRAGAELGAAGGRDPAAALLAAGDPWTAAEERPAGDLFDQARRVADAGDPVEEAMFWIGEREAYFLRPAGTPGQYRLVGVECDIPGEQLMTPFTDRYGSRLQGMPVAEEAEGAAPLRHRPPPAALSPDGRWLLWRAGGAPGGEWIAAPFDGGPELRWSPARARLGSSDALWRRDGREWVELVQEARGGGYRITRAILHSLDDPHGPRERRVDSAPGGMPLGTTDADEALVRDYDSGSAAQAVRFTRIGLREIPPMVRRQEVPLPRNSRLWEVALSPDGRRLAWLLSSRTTPAAYLERITLYESALDGRSMRPLGWTMTRPGSAGGSAAADRSGWPQSVKWTPSGRELSFVYRGGLYMVPAAR